MYFLLREGGLGPCLSLCNDRCPWSLVMPRSSWTTVVWLVLLVLTHLALCWLSRGVPLIVGRPKDFGCGGDFTGQFLEKVIVILTGAVVQTARTVWRCRSCSSSSRTLISPSWRGGFPMVQTIQLITEIHPSCRTLVVDVPVVQLQGPQVQFVVVDVAFMQRQVPTALCAGWASDSFIDISVERV